MIGRTISRYQIVEKLGEGGMGVVYRARDTHLGRFVAIKVLPAEKVANPDRKRRFVQEARAASALNHPNIITIHDIASANGVDFIVMEHVRGKTLDQLIPRHGLKLNEVLKHGVQIADALARAHAAGIIHRDLKPSNVMVSEDGLVKVLDFGLAKLTEPAAWGEDEPTRTQQAGGVPQTEEGVIVGTASYMSPEQAEGKKIDARSDIFSFGAVLYKMVTGRPAFHGDSRISTLAAVLNKDPKPASEITSAVPRDLEKIINRCLRKDPARRWQTMADLKVALEELKEESDSDVLTAAGGAEPWSAKTRRVSPLRVTGIVVVAMALVAAGWFWLGPSGTVQPEASLTAVPLTAYTGWEGMPTFSPDGNQVAFAWNGENQDNWDICVKFLKEGPAHRLTDHPANDYSPAWSPEGRRIAFCRVGPENFAIYFVSPLGGTERKLADLNTASWWRRQLSWSPDGKRLAFHDIDRSDGHFRIFLLDVETRDRHRLRIGSTEVPDHLSPTFSPDGQTLAFIGEKAPASVADIYLVSSSGGAPRRLTSDNRFIGGLAWTPDGQEIIFSSGAGVSDALLWSIRLSDGRRKPLAGLGEGALAPTVSREGLRLAYTRAIWDSNVWRFDTRGRTPPKKLIESTRADENPSFSTDGKHIAFVSERSGSNELWLCDDDGSNPVQLTSFGGPVIGWPAWSPDGRQIAFDSNKIGNYDIYVISVEGGAPRPLTTHGGLDARPRWSPDGRWIYFQSDRGGTTDIWKMPAGGGGSPVQVTEDGGYVPVVSADGRFVYYSKGRGSVWRVPARGGEETPVFGDVPRSTASDWFYWVPAEKGIYFVDQEDNNLSVKFVPFGAGRVKHVFDVESPAGSPPAISPDGKWLLYAQFDQVRRDLMLVENFR